MSQECITKKIIVLTNQVKDIIKSLCTNCGFAQKLVKNSASQNMCSIWNSIFCPDCIKDVSSIKCHSKYVMIIALSAKFVKRSCKDNSYIYDSKICQMCEYTYCQEHFDAHKKLNHAEPFKITCANDKCKLSHALNIKAFYVFTSLIVNAGLLKE